jgi:hypothetical protein
VVGVLNKSGLGLLEIERVLCHLTKVCRVKRYEARGGEQQEWLGVVRQGFTHYRVSNLGFVRCRNKRPVKPDRAQPYPRVILSSPGGVKEGALVHLLVWECFVLGHPFADDGIDDEKALQIINHKDGDKWNPALTNLERISQSQNTLDAYKNGHRKSNKKRKPPTAR